MAPSAVFMRDKVRLYYTGRNGATNTYSILLADAPLSDPTNFTPKNLALTFVLPANPTGTQPGEGYYGGGGPWQTSVLPALDANGDPKMTGGVYDPWYLYFTTYKNNTGVAKSTDGGLTFSLVPNKNPLFPYHYYQVRNASGVLEWQGSPVPSKSKPYDYGQCGSSCCVKTDDGTHHLFTTALGPMYRTFEDCDVTASDVSHPSGGIGEIGIGYSTSTDAETFTRHTSQFLGVTSPAARGTGRIIDPRSRDEPNGLFEYIVSRPMVFRDGSKWRMTVSSHSVGYRARSLYSTDLINWTWNESPAEGFLGFGASGSFDSNMTAYPDCHRQGNTYHCYYTGNDYGSSSGPTGIGYATASVIP